MPTHSGEDTTTAETQHLDQAGQNPAASRTARPVVELVSAEQDSQPSLVPGTTQQIATPNRPQAGETDHTQRRDLPPDPHSIYQISLSEEKDGPMMRLLRSRQYRQMQIRFDQKPPKDVPAQLRKAGWAWNRHDEAWFLPLGHSTEISKAVEAERLFLQLGNQIRESYGLASMSLSMSSDL